MLIHMIALYLTFNNDRDTNRQPSSNKSSQQNCTVLLLTKGAAVGDSANLRSLLNCK